MARAVVGGGCFWCVEGAYKEMKGIESALPAYAGGHDPNPNYNSVCSGVTGHAEVVEIIFDESIISYETILEVFFTVHDPTQLNRQGNDIGPHYRSVIFYNSESQRRDSYSVIDEMGDVYSSEIVTEVSPLKNFYVAEKYHHDYFKNNPSNPYCMVIVAPKIAKTRAKHAHLYE